jgi:hypothetical protein
MAAMWPQRIAWRALPERQANFADRPYAHRREVAADQMLLQDWPRVAARGGAMPRSTVARLGRAGSVQFYRVQLNGSDQTYPAVINHGPRIAASPICTTRCLPDVLVDADGSRLNIGTFADEIPARHLAAVQRRRRGARRRHR